MQFDIRHTITANNTLICRGEFSPGEKVALLGNSGAGKTTLMRLLSGLLPSTQGTVTDAGVPMGHGWQNQVTLVHQQPVMFAHHTVAQTIAYGAKYNRAHALPMSQWLQRLDLDALTDTSCAKLSGGQAQRVALLRALATGRRWVLLDEAFSALDSARLLTACDVVADYCRLTGAGLVVASHQEAPQRFLCQSAYLIDTNVGRYEPNVFNALNSRIEGQLWSTLYVTAEQIEHGFLRVCLGDDPLYVSRPEHWQEGHARVSIAAGDVSLAIGAEHQTSMVNRLAAVITDICPLEDDRMLVSLDVGGQLLRVLISPWSCARLGLQQGQAVFAEFKVGAVQWHGQL